MKECKARRHEETKGGGWREQGSGHGSLGKSKKQHQV